MDKLDDTWNNRDYPVLREAARGAERNAPEIGPDLHDIAEATGLSIEAVDTAARALEGAGLIQLGWSMGIGNATVEEISPEARRLVGLWPTPETALDRMVAALEAIAANTDDEDTRTRAWKALDAISGAGRSIGIAVASAAITGQIPT
jgi:hypothetical protein